MEEGGRGLARYSKAELELLIEVLRQTQALQEAHTERIRGMRRDSRSDDKKGARRPGSR